MNAEWSSGNGEDCFQSLVFAPLQETYTFNDLFSNQTLLLNMPRAPTESTELNKVPPNLNTPSPFGRYYKCSDIQRIVGSSLTVNLHYHFTVFYRDQSPAYFYTSS